jgi:hypothetical protein
VSDIDTIVVDGLKALDPEWPIREATLHARACVNRRPRMVRPLSQMAIRSINVGSSTGAFDSEILRPERPAAALARSLISARGGPGRFISARRNGRA